MEKKCKKKHIKKPQLKFSTSHKWYRKKKVEEGDGTKTGLLAFMLYVKKNLHCKSPCSS